MGIPCFLLLSPAFHCLFLSEHLPRTCGEPLVLSHLIQYDQYGLWCLHFYTMHQSTTDWWVQGSLTLVTPLGPLPCHLHLHLRVKVTYSEHFHQNTLCKPDILHIS